MSKTRIESLRLCNFRGASAPLALHFDVTKPITVIVGQNGTGKSSIVDGLEFIFKGTPGSLDDISGATPSRHLVSLGARSDQIEAEVALSDGTVVRAGGLRKSRTKKAATGSQVGIRAAILRRSQLLTLLNAQPSLRYAALKQFIDVAGVEAAEAALEKAIREAGATIDTFASQYTFADQELRRLFQETQSVDTLGKTYLDWGKDHEGLTVDGIVGRLSNLLNAVNGNAELKSRFDTERQEEEVLAELREEVSAARANFLKLGKKAPEAATALMDLLLKAAHYLEQHHDLKSCPLCRAPKESATLRAEINERLSAVPGLREARDAVAHAEDRLRNQEQVLAARRAETVAFAKRLVEACGTFLITEKVWSQKLIDAIIGLKDGSDHLEAIQALLSSFAPHHSRMAEEYQRLDARRHLLATIQSHYRTCTAGKAEASDAENAIPHMARMLEVIRAKRQTFIQSLLTEIAAEFERLYQVIHPGEPLGGFRLDLDQNKRASLGLSATFCEEQELPPQAYYSESHADTLGFACFTALAKLSNEKTLLIIDDAFVSVDTDHLKRIFQLLQQEAPNFLQIIITTHETMIGEWIQSGELSSALFSVVELEPGWSLGRGIRARGGSETAAHAHRQRAAEVAGVTAKR